MSIARTRLVERASLLREAALRPDLISKPPQEVSWNEHARLVKAAMCISSFTSLEEFIQARIREILQKFHGFAPVSRGLPEGLRQALVIGAFEALATRIKDAKRFSIVDPHAYILAETRKIASSGGAGLDPTDLALATNGSNLSWKVIEDALIAFAVDNPASVINGVARRIEGGIFVAKDHFESVMLARHKVAHVADTDVPLADVINYVEKLVLFCASFDLVISTAAKRVLGAAFASAPPTTKAADIKVRFVEKSAREWRVIRENTKRARSRHVDQSAAVFAGEQEAAGHVECVVIRADSSTSLTTSWSTPFL